MPQKTSIDGIVKQKLVDLIRRESAFSMSRYHFGKWVPEINFGKYIESGLLEKALRRFSDYNGASSGPTEISGIFNEKSSSASGDFVGLFLTYIFSEDAPHLLDGGTLPYKENKMKIKTAECSDIGDIQLPELSGKVLLKPNLVSAHPYPETSDYGIIDFILKKIKENNGVTKLYVADGPSLFFNSNAVFGSMGLQQLASANGAELVDFYGSKYYAYMANSCGTGETNGDSFVAYLPELLFGIDYVINLTNLKEHNSTGFSGAVKNHLGMIAPFQRLAFHRKMNLLEGIQDVYRSIAANFHIMDSRKFMAGAQQRIYGGTEAPGFGFFYGTDAAEIDRIAFNRLSRKITPAGEMQQGGTSH